MLVFLKFGFVCQIIQTAVNSYYSLFMFLALYYLNNFYIYLYFTVLCQKETLRNTVQLNWVFSPICVVPFNHIFTYPSQQVWLHLFAVGDVIYYDLPR